MIVVVNNRGDKTEPSVSVGFPNPALESADVPLDLNKLVVKNPISTFYMRIGGDDWLEYGINRGDIVVIDRVQTPRKNTLVVVTQAGDFGVIRYDRLTEEAELWGAITHIVHKVS